jgi:hypothetical protein
MKRVDETPLILVKDTDELMKLETVFLNTTTGWLEMIKRRLQRYKHALLILNVHLTGLGHTTWGIMSLLHLPLLKRIPMMTSFLGIMNLLEHPNLMENSHCVQEH